MEPKRVSNTKRTERTRLHLERVDKTISAEVVAERPDGMVITQSLDFLQLGSVVRCADGRRSRIARIAIAVQSGTPRLLLELAHDPAEAPVESHRTSADELFGQSRENSGVRARPRQVRPDATVPYRTTASGLME